MTVPPPDSRLILLLSELLSEESLPPVDRWFSRTAKTLGWPASHQKRLWDDLRRALCRGLALAGHESPAAAAWPAFRVALRGRAAEWAGLAGSQTTEPTLENAGIPFWWKDFWLDRVKRSGWAAEAQGRFLRLQETPPPVHVRFHDGPEGAAVRQRLTARGLIGASDVEGIARLTATAGLEGSEDWRLGLIEIQDAASQLSLQHLELRPGHRVWDVCAGRGGKTLLAAGELRGRGAIVGTDVSAGKLRALKERVRRSGWQNIRLLGWDGGSLPSFGAEMGRGFDRVVVDAPCTASGTWRRDPEGRYRMTPESLKELQRHQARLIRLGWSALKPGGRLAYVTCSWLPAENEEIVEAFAAETGAALLHQTLLGLPEFDANTLYSAILEKP